jgi:hypothetical protein
VEPSPSCTEHAGSVSEATAQVQSAGGEAVVCLAGGSYPQLNLAGAHSAKVTIEPEPGSVATIAGIALADGASDITIHNFFVTGGVSLGAGDSLIAIDHNDIDGAGPGGNGEGIETRTVNCTAPNAPVYAGCESDAPATYITISANTIHGYGEGSTEDAIHLNNWHHVRVSANELYNLQEHGNHTDALQSVWGGSDLVFDHNYEHDNQAQGFFIKDGDAAEVTVADNLFLRNNDLGGEENNIQVFDTAAFAMRNNTVWDGQGDLVRAAGSSQPLGATVEHNVEQVFSVLYEGGPAYQLTEDWNVFQEDPWTFSKGPHSTVLSAPEFADPAANDYRLKSNPDHIGVDWAPAEFVYGPTGN